MAALAAMMAKSMAKGMAKSLVGRMRYEARGMANRLKRNARELAYDYRNKARAAATNYLDEQKNRIYQTARNSFYTKVGGGRRNYAPVPAYRNEVGTNNVERLY